MLLNVPAEVSDTKYCSGCKYIYKIHIVFGIVNYRCDLFSNMLKVSKKDKRRKLKCGQCLKLSTGIKKLNLQCGRKSNVVVGKNFDNVSSYNTALNHIFSRVDFDDCKTCGKKCENFTCCAVGLFKASEALDKDI